MKRSFLLFAIALFVVGMLFDRQSSHAVDADKPVSAVEAMESAEIAKLLARIESLENRVATLERTEPLVRQADSRDSELEFQPHSAPPKALPRDNDQRNKDDSPAQQINGQTWRFRLLSNTRQLPSGGR